jgi:HK97 family phage prohead protease
MSDHMLAPVEWKAAVGSKSGELEGHASVFGNVDQGGDVVLPGAFKKTLADWARSRQPLPLIADHQLSTDGVIGSVTEAKEDGVGLHIRARFASDQKSQDVRTKMLEGHIRGMSFTYDAVKHRVGMMAGKEIRYLEEIKLYETTVTPFPMNVLALASAKDANGLLSPVGLDDEMFYESLLSALGITYEPARKASVDALIAAHQLAAAGPVDEPPTADAAADSKSVDTADPSAYALGFTTHGPRDGAPEGEPPDALAYPDRLLADAKDQSDLDALEAQITQALGRTDDA